MKANIITIFFPMKMLLDKRIILHTHLEILNSISLKNDTWHLTFRSINSWMLCRMVISTACKKTPMDILLKFVYCIDYLMLVLDYNTIWVL